VIVAGVDKLLNRRDMPLGIGAAGDHLRNLLLADHADSLLEHRRCRQFLPELPFQSDIRTDVVCGMPGCRFFLGPAYVDLSVARMIGHVTPVPDCSRVVTWAIAPITLHTNAL